MDGEQEWKITPFVGSAVKRRRYETLAASWRFEVTSQHSSIAFVKSFLTPIDKPSSLMIQSYRLDKLNLIYFQSMISIEISIC